TNEVEPSTIASASAAGPKTNAAPPHPAGYSSASPGCACAVSMPMAIAASTNPEPTKATAACIASLPALQADSMSAATRCGVIPSASATMVADGLTAYGFDSVPTHSAPIRSGSSAARSSAVRAASMDIVTTSSSSAGTDFSATAGAAAPF